MAGNNSPEIDLSSPTIDDSNSSENKPNAKNSPIVINGQWRNVDEQEDNTPATTEAPITPEAAVNTDTQNSQTTNEGSPEEDKSTATDTNWAQQLPKQEDKQSVTNVVRKDGIDKLSSDADEQSTSYIASSKNTQFDPEHTFKPNEPEYKKSDKKKVWSIKKGEKPTELIKDSDYSIDRVRSEKDERTKSLKDLDETDQHGMRVGYRSSYKTAERVKLLDNLKEYDKELREGKKLTEEEKDLLFKTELSKIKSYQDRKKSYESKKLSEEDIKILLDEHFKEEINDILESFKDNNGEFNSSTLTIEQLGLLKDTYRRNLVREKAQDDMTKMDESDQRFREKREKEYLEENPNWTPEAARDKQRIEIADRETELYREQMLQEKKKTDEEEEEEQITPDVTPEESNPEEGEDSEARERKIKRAALIAGALAGGTTGVLVGTSAIPVIATSVFVVGALSTGAEFVGKRRIVKLREKISQTSEAEEKVKLEKRYQNWQNVVKWAGRAKSFLGGDGLGLFAGSLINSRFLEGQGLVTRVANKRAAPSVKAEGPTVAQQTTADTAPSNVTGGGQNTGVQATPQPTTNLSPESLPNRISFNDYPQLRDGLVRRGMDPNTQTLLIKGTPGGWANAQGEVIKKMLNMGINPNTQEAGWAVGDLAANHVNNNLQISEQTIQTALKTAKQILGSN